jgi:CRP-like cAMP-binding protein
VIGKTLAGGGAKDMAALWTPVLQEVSLFAGVPKRHLRRIAALTKEARFERGSSIVRRGERGETFFLILEGTAHVVRTGGLPPIELSAGDYFGEMALIDGDVRSASVVAQTDVRCLRLSRTPFMKMLKAEPELCIVMLRHFVGRIRELQARQAAIA